ncbi:MAG: hypothetical protein ACOYVK_14655 [Bacillota bacterium]
MIKIDAQRIKEVERQLGSFMNKAPTVISRALNRAAANAKTNAVKKAKEGYTVKSAGLSKTISIKKTTKSSLGADVRSIGERIPLIKFSVKPKNPNPKGPPQALIARIRKNEPRS